MALAALNLRPIDHELATGLAGAHPVAAFSCGANEELVRQVVAATLALYERSPRCEPWICYLAVDSETSRVVGTCGFKAGPAGGSVEIAYFTFPEFEGRGYATEMAGLLVGIVRSGGVPTVAAETAPERNASTRILEKLGFALVGETVDADIGKAWRWERPADGSAPDVQNSGSAR